MSQTQVNDIIDIIDEASNIENALVNPNVINYDDPNVRNHKDQFEKAMNEKYPIETTQKKKTSFVMRKIEHDWIMDILKGVKKLQDHNKKHHLKKKRYAIDSDGHLVRTMVDPDSYKASTITRPYRTS